MTKTKKIPVTSKGLPGCPFCTPGWRPKEEQTDKLVAVLKKIKCATCGRTWLGKFSLVQG